MRKEYCVIIVWGRQVEWQRVRAEFTVYGNGPYTTVLQSAVYPSWDALLQRRKPWAQPGPIHIVRAPITGWFVSS